MAEQAPRDWPADTIQALTYLLFTAELDGAQEAPRTNARIPQEYEKWARVFSKEEAEKLPQEHSLRAGPVPLRLVPSECSRRNRIYRRRRIDRQTQQQLLRVG